MPRQTTVLAAIVALNIVILPAAALAGGRAHVSPGLHARTSLPARASFTAIPEFRPQGAFGSPGGYPFVERAHPFRFKAVAPGHHRFPHRTFVTWGPSAFLYTPGALYEPASVTPPVVTGSPVIYASPTVSVASPVMAPQAAAVPAVSSREELTPRVVEHPTGRYELRGDGVAIPYVWVWIPHPPAEPPPMPTSASEPPRAGADRSARRTETYRWTDEEGTTFLTNRPERIPPSHRSQAQEPAS